ncbi:family 16 glycosylhydrolase, partial [Brevibacterium sp. R8603A2]|uniref:family 16 glycosylhydrolase n=1 Tax=Brevibacterium sp. R8603A2 TaxID=2929779 RepID=UPI001FFA9D13
MHPILRTLVAGIAAAMMILGFVPLTGSPHSAITGGSVAHAATLTPKGPTFNDTNFTVYIPSDQGIRYYIDVDGENVTKDDLDYAKPGNYTAEDGIERGVPIKVTAKPAGSRDELSGETEWTHEFAPPTVRTPKGPTFNNTNFTVYIPSDHGVRYYIEVDGEPITSPGYDYAGPGTYGAEQGVQRGVPITVTAGLVSDREVLEGDSEWTHEFAPPVTRTPKGPTFNDTNGSVYIPSDYGVRYSIDVDGEAVTSEGHDYAAPGNYTAEHGIERGVPITVTARAVSSQELLDGTTEWIHEFPPAPADPEPVTPKGPTFTDSTRTVYIPSDRGVRYHIDVDGTAVTKDGLDFAKPGAYTEADGIRSGAPITVTAVSAGSQTVLTGVTEWTHEFEPPETLTPKGPTFDEWDATVYIPSDRGIRYYIDVDGTNITVEDLPYAKPGFYGAPEGIRTGVSITVTAQPVSSQAVLDGTTEWEIEFHTRPDRSLASGDEFDDEPPIPNAGWSVYNTRASSLSDVANTVYTKDAVRVKDGNLEIRTARHCLTGDEEPTEETESPGGAVCPAGTRTVYTSGRINTDFLYDAPFEMEVRARMSDRMIDGMHFAAWMRNNQPYCTTPGVERSRMSEIDTMEVLSSRAKTTNTTHVTCEKRKNATGTRRDGHSMPGQIAGAWNTYRMTWDGYAVRYYFNDQLVPSDRGQTPETTGKTLGMDQDDFRSAMNDHPYQVIIDSIVFPDTVTWIPPAKHDRPFPARVDRVDYLRMKPIDDIHPRGAIGRAWKNTDWLGAPLSAEEDAGPVGARKQEFEHGTVYWSSATGAHPVKGEVRKAYDRLDGPDGFLGLPISGENPLAKNGGASQSFEGGQIHWSRDTGAHATRGAIQRHWRSQGWENGRLGYPTSEETPVAGGGVRQSFQGGV